MCRASGCAGWSRPRTRWRGEEVDRSWPIARLERPMRHFLEFERPIAELEGKIEELRHLSTDGGLNIADEVGRLESKADRLLRQTYAQADAVAEGAGGAPSRAAALPRLHRRR